MWYICESQRPDFDGVVCSLCIQMCAWIKIIQSIARRGVLLVSSDCIWFSGSSVGAHGCGLTYTRSPGRLRTRSNLVRQRSRRRGKCHGDLSSTAFDYIGRLLRWTGASHGSRFEHFGAMPNTSAGGWYSRGHSMGRQQFTRGPNASNRARAAGCGVFALVVSLAQWRGIRPKRCINCVQCLVGGCGRAILTNG